MRVVSTTVFGKPDYNEPGSMANYYWRSTVIYALSALGVYKGWSIRIHVDIGDWVASPLQNVLAWMNTRFDDISVKFVPQRTDDRLCSKMLWRMLPMFDESVDAFVCRDVDAVAMRRERLAVEHWLRQTPEDQFIGHMLRDSTSHGATPMMGGMCGFRPECVREAAGWGKFTDMMLAANRINMHTKGADQILLSEHLDKVIGPRVCEHVFLGRTCRTHKQLDVNEIQVVNEAALLDTNTADAIDTLYDNDPQGRRVGIGQMYDLKAALDSLVRHGDERTLETLERIRQDANARKYFRGHLPED